MARRIEIAQRRRRRHPLLRDLQRMHRGDTEDVYGYAPVLEPELQYEQGSWFPSSSSSTSAPMGTTTDDQRHWGELCLSPGQMTPVEDDEVRRSLKPLFDMEIFGGDDGNDDEAEGLGACAHIGTETDIISSLEEGYLPSPAVEVSACEEEEETGSLKRSDSLVSFKDLQIPPPKAPSPAPIAALKRRVSYACETATGAVKGSKAAAATSSFVGNVFEYLIEKGF